MQNTQVAKRNQPQNNSQHGRVGKTKPSRLFEDGRVPSSVEAAQTRLVMIKRELAHANNLLKNAIDTNSERHNCRKKFVEHTEKEISRLEYWILENNAEKTASATKEPMSAREKIQDTVNYLTALQKKGSLSPKEIIILDLLVDYSVNA